MRKKNLKNNQIILVIVAIIISLCGVVVSALILSNQIRSKNSTGENKEFDKSILVEQSQLDEESQTEIDSKPVSEESKKADSIVTSKTDMVNVQIKKGADEYIEYSALELIGEFRYIFENYGYVNGGYTIYNNEICPDMTFVVQESGGTILDEKVVAITVTGIGKLSDGVFVGMNYKEIKAILGDKLAPIEQSEENCMFALAEFLNCTATLEFESSGGDSIKAVVMSKD